MAVDSKSPVAGNGVKAGGMSKLDEAIARVRECKFLAEDEFKALCDICKAILMEQNNIQPVNAPVTVVGDIHGQFYDMLEMFKVGGEMPKTRYVFLGDFVDRGHHSLETITLLFLYLAKYPGAITLIRGNHESRQVTQVYGFYDECFKKYGSANVWKYCTEVFDYLPLGALIDGAVFCVHGGLSPDITMLDQIRLIERNQEIPHEGPYCDLLWSDPEEKVDTWKQSERGAGWQFGAKVTAQFNQLNDLQLICRAHQLVEEGYKYMFEDKSLITVWSAPNYCYRCGNKAAILAFDQYLDREIKLFKEVHKEPRLAHEHPPNMDYFL